MIDRVEIKGRYVVRPNADTAAHWRQICNEHSEEFSRISTCHPGTFNLILTQPKEYAPPGDLQYRIKAKERGKAVGRYVYGNHLSPRARVIQINGKDVEAWIYRGGHPDSVLELISPDHLAAKLGVKSGDALSLVILEYALDGMTGIPVLPPRRPGVSQF
jgi:hypothetical protein